MATLGLRHRFRRLDHVLASGEDVNVLVFDTEVYSNTGGQSSKSTPLGSVAQFAAAGKQTRKRTLGAIAMSYGYVYVAQVAMGADMNQTIKAFRSRIIPRPLADYRVLACINYGQGGMGNAQQEGEEGCSGRILAPPTGLTRARKSRSASTAKGAYRILPRLYHRRSALQLAAAHLPPTRAEELFAQAERRTARYQHLLRLAELSQEKVTPRLNRMNKSRQKCCRTAFYIGNRSAKNARFLSRRIFIMI